MVEDQKLPHPPKSSSQKLTLTAAYLVVATALALTNRHLLRTTMCPVLLGAAHALFTTTCSIIIYKQRAFSLTKNLQDSDRVRLWVYSTLCTGEIVTSTYSLQGGIESAGFVMAMLRPLTAPLVILLVTQFSLFGQPEKSKKRYFSESLVQYSVSLAVAIAGSWFCLIEMGIWGRHYPSILRHLAALTTFAITAVRVLLAGRLLQQVSVMELVVRTSPIVSLQLLFSGLVFGELSAFTTTIDTTRTICILLASSALAFIANCLAFTTIKLTGPLNLAVLYTAVKPTLLLLTTMFLTEGGSFTFFGLISACSVFAAALQLSKMEFRAAQVDLGTPLPVVAR